MRDIDQVLAALGRSKFRSRFRLQESEAAYLAQRGLAAAVKHARQFVHERLASAQPPNGGRQTPWRGHTVFVAQHATATCCRSCLAKWHGIERGQPLSSQQIEYVVQVIQRWLANSGKPPAPDRRTPGSPKESERQLELELGL
jgi:hypothetical protein